MSTGTVTSAAPTVERPPAAIGALHGLLVEFDSAEALLAAARRVRDAGFTKWDAHSPYPVHGLDRAVGLRPTELPWLVLVSGATGAAGGLLIQWWTNAVDYRFLISGKPFFSLPANIPVMFETTVLLAAVGAFIGMLALNGLPRLYHALFSSARFRRATVDRFFISVEAADPKFDPLATRRFLEALGGTVVEEVREAPTAPRPRWIITMTLIAGAAALIPLALAARARVARTSAPRIHLVGDMDNQEKYKAQHANAVFADGRSARPPVAGTVARGADELGADDHYDRGYRRTVDSAGGVEKIEYLAGFPAQVRVTEPLMRRGQERFGVYCAPCHGLDGSGKGIVSERALKREESSWVPPTSLHDAVVRARPEGHLFNTITSGIRTMPAYGDQIAAADRWAIVAYVRALQRSTNARVEDVPVNLRDQLR